MIFKLMKPDARLRVVTPIQSLLIVDEITRRDCVRFRSESTPGHLIHVVESGEVTQHAEGRPETFREGHVVWYHESEPIEGSIVRAPWRFITINFTARDLAPPPDDRRVLQAGPHTLTLARQLLLHWRDRSLPGAERALRCVATLAGLILDFLPLDNTPALVPVYPMNARERWWIIEKHLRQQLDQPPDLDAIAKLVGMSVRTTIRACKAATGMTPVQRLKALRLTYAHGLLQHSNLPVTEIALRVGYERVQEFSRDIKKRHGCTPLELRRRPPEYRHISRLPT